MELEQHRLHCRECDVLYDSTFKAIKIVTGSNSFELAENIQAEIIERVMAKLKSDPK
jgi:dihydroneopterin aldolase